MLFTISGKHIEVTEAMRQRAQEKTAKLPRYYSSINQIEVVVDGSEGGSIVVEIIARAEHSKVFISTERGQDAYQCIDMAAHKLEAQLRRIKSRERDNKHADDSEPTESDGGGM